MDKLLPMLTPLMYENGGPILMVQVRWRSLFIMNLDFRISDNFSQFFLIIISINVDSNDAGICIIVTKWGESQKPNFYLYQ